MAVAINVQIKNLSKLQKQIESVESKGRQAVADTVNDLKRRVPGWVADAVTERYGIKKGEITPQGTSTGSKKKAGAIHANGETLKDFTVTYSGRLLTPTHFKMKPTVRPDGKKKYSVTAEVLKGARKRLTNKAFLGKTGTTDADKVQEIPFQRKGDDRLPLVSIKSISLPQMVDNEDVRDVIYNRLGEGLQKRLDHNVQRRMGM
jgi:hypothetical protein